MGSAGWSTDSCLNTAYLSEDVAEAEEEPETGVSQLQVETFLKHVSVGGKLYNLSSLVHWVTMPPYSDDPRQRPASDIVHSYSSIML